MRPPRLQGAITLAVISALIWQFAAAAQNAAQGTDQTQQALDTLYKSEMNAGAALYQAQKYKEALKAYQIAGASAVDSGEAKLMAGTCLYQLRQYKEALAQYEKVAKEGKLISVRNKAQKSARSLDLLMRGICPGNCLKPSTPGWRKMHVDGKPDYLVWMVFPYLDTAGAGGSEYWSNDHMGEVIEYVNGRPIDKGKCPICGGTGHVTLP